MMAKLTIVGAGNLGSQAAFYSALKGFADIVLVDIVEGMPQGKALDMQQAMAVEGSNVKIVGSNDYEATKDSDVVIIPAGIPRKPGMAREDLLATNAKILKSVIPSVVKYSPNSVLIIVTNPLDAMVYLAYKLSGFPKNRVIGMAGVLDSARFRTFVAQELKEDINNIQAMVLGSHGDLMVPLLNHCKVKGKPIKELIDDKRLSEIVERTRKGGAEIVGLLKTGSAFFAPGLSAAEMAESIIKDQKKILPCAALCEGEYDINGVFVGVPAKLGKQGVEEIVELELNEEEKNALQKSVEHIKLVVKKMEELI
ncbi:malate dehydrogenase [Candidatus Woesearchaeota archaeon]|nr:malate dehydrogenase [Candidatus Woesearchaeota archaeon]